RVERWSAAHPATDLHRALPVRPRDTHAQWNRVEPSELNLIAADGDGNILRRVGEPGLQVPAPTIPTPASIEAIHGGEAEVRCFEAGIGVVVEADASAQ